MKKTSRRLAAFGVLLFLVSSCSAQESAPTPTPASDEQTGTSTDLFIMLGSDFVRPGLAAKANYNIGIGHTFGFLKKDPIGDELTFAYTYEDGGSGFWHSQFGSHTESFGVMKNFGLPKTTRVSGYTWVQIGISSFTGNAQVQNHFYDGKSLGAVCTSICTTPFGSRRRSIRSYQRRGIRRRVSGTQEAGELAHH
jgi:hypothetical protein